MMNLSNITASIGPCCKVLNVSMIYRLCAGRWTLAGGRRNVDSGHVDPAVHTGLHGAGANAGMQETLAHNLLFSI
jgi:hypothetical protein